VADILERTGLDLCFARTSSDSLVTIRHPRATAARRTQDRTTSIF
jgi:hypothetical protein